MCSGGGIAIRIGLDNDEAADDAMRGALPKPGRRTPRRSPDRPRAESTALPEPASDSILRGLRFVVTGKFDGLSRTEIEALIASAGGIAAKTVSRRIDHLVVGEKPGSKLAKASEYGIKTLDLAGLGNLLRGG